MAAFKMKEWLDTNVVPLLSTDLKIYSFIWNGDPPKQILVWLVAACCPLARTGAAGPDAARERALVGQTLQGEAASTRAAGDDELAEPEPFDPAQWPRAAHDFRFDYLREQQMVQLESGLIPIFGGDGAPLFGKEGTTAVRLFKRMDDGIDLILQVGCLYPASTAGADAPALSPGQHAAAAVKGFFGLFDVPALEVCQKFSAPFGQA